MQILQKITFIHTHTLLYIHLQIYANTPCCHSTLIHGFYKSQRWLYVGILDVNEQTRIKDKWYVWCGDRYFPHFMPQCLEQSMWFLENTFEQLSYCTKHRITYILCINSVILASAYTSNAYVPHEFFFLVSHYEFSFIFNSKIRTHNEVKLSYFSWKLQQ